MPIKPFLLILTLAGVLPGQESNAWDNMLDIADSLRGTLTLGAYHHFAQAAREANATRYQANLELEFAGDIGKRTNYFFTPRIYLDNLNWASGVVNEEPETRANRFILDLGEAYLRYTAASFDVTLGRQIFRWGVADAINPVDNINPLDLLDVPTATKMGVFSGALRYSSENFSWTVVAIPWFTPSRLPANNSRWLGDLGEAPQRFPGFNLALGARELPSQAINNAAYGFHLTSSSLLTGWDFALSFYDGIDPIGVLRGDLDGTNITLTQVFPHFRESGASFSTTWRNMEMHGEAGFHDTHDNRMDDDYFEYVLGMNLTYDNVPATEETFIVLEYANEQIIHDKPPHSLFSGSGEYVRPFKGTWIASVNFKFNEATSLKFSGLRNQGSHDGFARAELMHKFNDFLKLEVGVECIDGDAATFFGRWRNNDRLFVNWKIFI